MYDKAMALIRRWEGCRLEAYRDVAGIPTIGYGSTLGVKMGDTISQTDADALLLAEVERKATGLKAFVTIPLTDNETAAVISLAFNLGLGAIKGSTMLADLNKGDRLGACAEMARWHRAGGQRIKGLLRRRLDEMSLFLADD